VRAADGEDAVRDGAASSRVAPPEAPVREARPAPPPLDEEKVRRVELIISLVLRVGVVTALLVVLAGFVDGLVTHPAERSSTSLEHRLLTRAAHYPHSFGQLFAGLGRGDPQAIVVAGLVLLVLTPVMRVAVSIFTFVYQHDRIFVVVTSLVLAILIASFLLGKAGG
jgi:uncharacterized membrane protein